MKILSSTIIKDWDTFTIANEPISSIELMERASKAVFNFIINKYPSQKRFFIFCGPGNNGGDGLVIARLLHQNGKQINIYLVGDSVNVSSENSSNQQLLPIPFQSILTEKDFPKLIKGDIIIDALFGIGLNKPPEGIIAFCINQINNSGCDVVSIDCPSGLYADNLDQPENTAIIKATYTLTFQAPKPAFMAGKGLLNCGKLTILDIGLSPDFLSNMKHSEHYIQLEDIQKIYSPRNIDAEKHDFGSALLIGGSYGMIGSITMATKAALRCGAGTVTILAPNCGYEVLQSTVPEAMVLESPDEKILHFLPDINRFTTIAVGPGLGKNNDTSSFINSLLELKLPMVLDADALNVISANNWQLRIPKGSIITPHRREFSRLFGETTTESQILTTQKNKAAELGIYIVLKGAHTRITFPNNEVYYNSTGNPGMAKGGSGDVLTGIITGLWARFNDAEKAVLMGVYLHGLAGDIAVTKYHQESIIASDIIDSLANSFKKIY